MDKAFKLFNDFWDTFLDAKKTFTDKLRSATSAAREGAAKIRMWQSN